MWLQLSKEWDIPVDNVYAQGAFNELPDLSQTVDSFSALDEEARLCEKCQNIELWKPNFHVSETREELENMSSTCDFCRMRWNQCKRNTPIETTVHFSKVDSTLRLNEQYPPVLALCRPPGKLCNKPNHLYANSAAVMLTRSLACLRLQWRRSSAIHSNRFSSASGCRQRLPSCYDEILVGRLRP